MSDPTTFVLDGTRIQSIATFYDEVNRVLMSGEDWTLGPSLDALDDLLYGGFGALADVEHPVIVVRESARVRAALGATATREYYAEKLAHPETFHVERFTTALAELDAGNGQTYFDLVLDVFAGHPDVRLVLD
ncbi:barstar family protein [Microbacterium sp. bgisy203]|uniref:barstar family protein n=1 Tax=Microbacterium sp. bgisy203 TaxID=3413799 RepID=UPI003D74A77E